MKLTLWNGYEEVDLKLGYIEGVEPYQSFQSRVAINPNLKIVRTGDSLRKAYRGKNIYLKDKTTLFAEISVELAFTSGDTNYYIRSGNWGCTINGNNYTVNRNELNFGTRTKAHVNLTSNIFRDIFPEDNFNKGGASATNSWGENGVSNDWLDLAFYETDYTYDDGTPLIIVLGDNTRTCEGGIPIIAYFKNLIGESKFNIGYSGDSVKGKVGFLNAYTPVDYNAHYYYWHEMGSINEITTQLVFSSTTITGVEEQHIVDFTNTIPYKDVSTSKRYYVFPIYKKTPNDSYWTLRGLRFKPQQPFMNSLDITPDEPPKDDEKGDEGGGSNPEPPNPEEPNPDYPEPEPDEPSDDIPIPTPPQPAIAKSILISMYKMTEAQLQNLGEELWSKDFFDNILKLFTSPIDGVLSLMEFPFNVPSSNTVDYVQIGNYKFKKTQGYKLNNSIVSLNMGTITIDEKYHSYIDYTNSAIQIYLPFIGVRDISIEYIPCILELQYNIDLLSGQCVACLSVTSMKSDLNSVIGQWEGTIGYKIPLTARDFSNMASAIWNTANSVVQTGMSMSQIGNMPSKYYKMRQAQRTMENVRQTGNEIINLVAENNRITMTGDISSNGGLMGVLTPYLIITRPVQDISTGFYKRNGHLYNDNKNFSELVGYTETGEVLLNAANATEEEKTEIISLLQSGVIF